MTNDFDFPTISSVEELDGLIEKTRTSGEPVLVFNHDPWCPISARAYSEMRKMNLGPEVALVDVSRLKVVTRALSERTGIRHESPQVIIFRDGTAAWNASHFSITADAVNRVLNLAREPSN